MATIAGKHRTPAPARDAGDVFEELKELGAVALIGLVLALIVMFIVLALWQVAPSVAIGAGVGLAALVGWLVYWMRRPAHG